MQVIKTFLIKFFVGINVCVALLMLLSGLSSFVHPTIAPHLSLLGLVFPIFLIVNLLFILFWLLFSVRRVWIPLVAMLVCFPFIRDYCPINFSQKEPEEAIKVMSFNVESFDNGSRDEAGNYIIPTYLFQSKADIICLQEAFAMRGLTWIWMNDIMRRNGYHLGRIHGGRTGGVACYSKFPILSTRLIDYESKTNASILLELKYKEDTIYLINNHLESNKLSHKDRKQYKEIFTEPQQNNMEIGARSIIDKMSKAAAIRGRQVDRVAEVVDSLQGKPIILCGDFNDSPISYACQQFSRHLKSAYVQSGNGVGLTYHEGGFLVRIDHIMYSKEWESYGTYIDKTMKNSDHYPLITRLKINKNAR